MPDDLPGGDGGLMSPGSGQPAQLPPPPVVMPQMDASQAEPPSGLNSVGQKLAEYGDRNLRPFEHKGSMVGTVSDPTRRGKLEALGTADPTSPVTRTSEGWNIGLPKEGTRKGGVLRGALQGALTGIATTGKWQGALGGAGTGAIMGGVSPKLIQGLERHQEIGREQTEYDREMGNVAKQQQLGLQRSQTEENYAQAQRQRMGQRQVVQGNDGVYRSISQDTGLDTEGRPVTGKDPDAYQQSQVEAAERRDAETKRWHDLQNAKNVRAEKEKVDVVVNGKKFRVNANTAARIEESKRANAAKPSPGTEASLRAVIEDEAEKDALQRRKSTDERIAVLRSKREELTHRSVQNADGSWGWEEDMGATMTSKTSVAQLDKEIADLQKESDSQQRVAESAASNKRKAEAEAKAHGSAPNWKSGGSDLNKPIKGKPTGGDRPGAGKAFNLKAWAADNPGKDVNAKRKEKTDQGFTITE